jgi:hypothetical protein
MALSAVSRARDEAYDESLTDTETAQRIAGAERRVKALRLLPGEGGEEQPAHEG